MQEGAQLTGTRTRSSRGFGELRGHSAHLSSPFSVSVLRKFEPIYCKLSRGFNDPGPTALSCLKVKNVLETLKLKRIFSLQEAFPGRTGCTRKQAGPLRRGRGRPGTRLTCRAGSWPGGEDRQAWSGRRCPPRTAGVSAGAGEDAHGPRLQRARGRPHLARTLPPIARSALPRALGPGVREADNIITDVFLEPLRRECPSTGHTSLTSSRGDDALKAAASRHARSLRCLSVEWPVLQRRLSEAVPGLTSTPALQTQHASAQARVKGRCEHSSLPRPAVKTHALPGVHAGVCVCLRDVCSSAAEV